MERDYRVSQPVSRRGWLGQAVGAAGEAAISLAVDREAIAPDRRDVAHVTVDQGWMIPAADHEVSFRIQGEGRINGADSGKLVSHEDFQGNPRRVFSSMCLAIEQSTARPGRIRLTSTPHGLRSASVAITTSEGPRA